MKSEDVPDLADLQVWLHRLGPEEIEQAFYSTNTKVWNHFFYVQWRYCCGVMWNMVKGG